MKIRNAVLKLSDELTGLHRLNFSSVYWKCHEPDIFSCYSPLLYSSKFFFVAQVIVFPLIEKHGVRSWFSIFILNIMNCNYTT